MKPIEVLTTAFRDGTTDKQLARLVAYADNGKKFLCGPKEYNIFAIDGLG